MAQTETRVEYGIDYGDEVYDAYPTADEARDDREQSAGYYRQRNWDTSLLEPGTIVQRTITTTTTDWTPAQGMDEEKN